MTRVYSILYMKYTGTMHDFFEVNSLAMNKGHRRLHSVYMKMYMNITNDISSIFFKLIILYAWRKPVETSYLYSLSKSPIFPSTLGSSTHPPTFIVPQSDLDLRFSARIIFRKRLGSEAAGKSVPVLA